MLAATLSLWSLLLSQAPAAKTEPSPPLPSATQLAERIPETFAALANPTDARSHHQACGLLRGSMKVYGGAWLLVAGNYDQERPHWPKTWTWPTEARERAALWLRLARRHDRRQLSRHDPASGKQPRERFIADIPLYQRAISEGLDGRVAVLAEAVNAEEARAARLLWTFENGVWWGFWPTDEGCTRESLGLLTAMARDPRDWVHRPALRLLNNSMKLGANDEQLRRWIVPLAKQRLADPAADIGYEPIGTRCLTANYLPATSRDALIVSIAAQFGEHAPIEELLARCEPEIAAPHFGNRQHDYAYMLLTLIAPQLEAADHARVRKQVVAHARTDGKPNAFLHDRLLAALDGKPLPQWTPPDPRRRPPPPKVTAAQAHSWQHTEEWSAELEHLVVATTANEHAELRRLAYEALATRDPGRHASAWLLHETRYDPVPQIRRLAVRAPRSLGR